MDDPKAPLSKQKRSWARSLRPLLWWLGLVLVLFAYHTHERLSEATRLRFQTEMDGTRIDHEASATLDGVNIFSGQKIKPGRHEFVISYSKAHSFSTNLFIWYGENDLGRVLLSRLENELRIQIVPVADILAIRGPEFSAKYTNCGSVKVTVPTDRYELDVYWANYTESAQVEVKPTESASVHIAPALGDLVLESAPPGASVISDSGSRMGTTPLTISSLPAGIWRGEVRLEGYIPVVLALAVAAGQTNSFRTNLVNWQYAKSMEQANRAYSTGEMEKAAEAVTLALQAQPGDADALELQNKVGVKWHLQKTEALLAGRDYLSARAEAQAVLKISPENTNALSLLTEISNREKQELAKQSAAVDVKRTPFAPPSAAYKLAINEATTALDVLDFAAAIQAAERALKENPDDPAAGALRDKARAGMHLTTARRLMATGDIERARDEARAALRSDPNNLDAALLIKNLSDREQPKRGINDQGQ